MPCRNVTAPCAADLVSNVTNAKPQCSPVTLLTPMITSATGEPHEEKYDARVEEDVWKSTLPTYTVVDLFVRESWAVIEGYERSQYASRDVRSRRAAPVTGGRGGIDPWVEEESETAGGKMRQERAVSLIFLDANKEEHECEA